MTTRRISHYTATTALGAGRQAQWQALAAERSGLRPNDFPGCDLATWIGAVAGLEALSFPAELADYDCRNNRVAELGLQQDGFLEAARALIDRHGAARVGLFLGTSTSGIGQTELAYRARASETDPLPDWMRYRETHNVFSLGAYLRDRLGLAGVASVISTACSSSAKVFASADRAMQTGLCDAAIVGGVDSLCLTTLYGFNALQLVSADPCRPADAARNGLSLGEAAGFAIVEAGDGDGPQLLGYGESCDAHHMSAPHPEGRGALDAMRAALDRAGLAPAEVDYINLHGTATPANDASEDAAVSALFGQGTPCSSTKGWTGHTLGAAGIVETVLALLCLREGWLPRSLNTEQRDPALQADILLESRVQPLRHVLTNSFGFGGSNCSLLLGAGR